MRLIFACLQAIDVMTLKDWSRSSIIELNQDTQYLLSYRVYKRKVQIFMLKSTNITLKNRSRSSIFELNQVTPEMHPWYKFGPKATNIC